VTSEEVSKLSEFQYRRLVIGAHTIEGLVMIYGLNSVEGLDEWLANAEAVAGIACCQGHPGRGELLRQLREEIGYNNWLAAQSR
jgi:hypothetical protein